MLVVRIELWPNGDKSRARELSRAEIWNMSELAPVSDYGVHVDCATNGTAEFPILNHERYRGAWELVRRVAEEAAKRWTQIGGR